MILLQAETVTLESVRENLKQQLQGLPTGSIPLHLFTTQGGIVNDRNTSVTVVNVAEEQGSISARIMVFFDEIVSGCSCGDGEQAFNACAEMDVRVSKNTGELKFKTNID